MVLALLLDATIAMARCCTGWMEITDTDEDGVEYTRVRKPSMESMVVVLTHLILTRFRDCSSLHRTVTSNWNLISRR